MNKTKKDGTESFTMNKIPQQFYSFSLPQLLFYWSLIEKNFLNKLVLAIWNGSSKI